MVLTQRLPRGKLGTWVAQSERAIARPPAGQRVQRWIAPPEGGGVDNGVLQPADEIENALVGDLGLAFRA